MIPLASRQTIRAVRVRWASHRRVQVLKPWVVEHDVLRRVCQRGAAVNARQATLLPRASRSRAKQRTEQVLGGGDWHYDASPGWPASAHQRQAGGVHSGRDVRHSAAQRRHDVIIAAVASERLHSCAPHEARRRPAGSATRALRDSTSLHLASRQAVGTGARRD